MFIIVCIHPAFRRSGAGSWRRPRPRAGGTVAMRPPAAEHDNSRRDRASASVAGAASRARQRRACGTSLARSTSPRDNVSSGSVRTTNEPQILRARVMMLSNEIVFDIPRAVPEHVRPTREELLDWDHVARTGRNRSDRSAVMAIPKQRIHAVGRSQRHHASDLASARASA